MFIDEQARTEKRRFKRAKLSNPISFRLKDSNQFGGCLSCDISEGGMRVNFNDFVPVNTEMVLQTKLTNMPKIVDLTGKVVWLQRVPFSDRYQVGLQFTKVDPASQGEIRNYVKSHSSN